MGLHSSLVPHAAASTPDLRNRKLDRQLLRFPSRYRPQIVALAKLHRNFGDLAFSFPALLFVAAVSHAKRDRAQLQQRIIKGAALKTLAQLAGLPIWMRKLQPEAFAKPIGPVPQQDITMRQIVNHLPRRARHAAYWLRNVSLATEVGDEAFAVWVARECNNRREYEPCLRKLALWAWFSLRPHLRGHSFITKPWRPQMKLKTARSAANEWHDRLRLHITIADATLQGQWLEAKSVDGFDFVPLLTANDIHEEARIMENCVRSYGEDLACNRERLWSVQQHGQRLATLSIGPHCDMGLLCITQIKARKNALVSRELALAATRWFNSHDILSIHVEALERNKLMSNRQAWVTLFKPWWLEKRCIPGWLPLAPKQHHID